MAVPVRQAAGKPGTAAGFTLIEMVMSMAIMLVVTGAVFQMVGGAQSIFRTQPEAADMQQRLRLASDMIYKDLLMAGAGPSQTTMGSLGNYFPPLSPARRGVTNPDAELAFAADRISVVYAARSRAQTGLLADLVTTRSHVTPDTLEAGCPTTALCGFTTDMRTLIVDTSAVGAGYDLFTVTGTTGNAIKHDNPNLAFSKAYARSGTRLMEAEHHVYYHDPATKQLMHYDGHQTTQELVDNVSSLEFTYYADPDPNSAPKPGAGLANCVYSAGDPPTPLLADLGGEALKPLTAAQLTDGPTCGVAPNRFDGDLLRVRKVRVTIRVQAADATLRGGGTQFSSGGTSKSGERYVPDYVMSFEVAPRNLNLIR